ncbi:MAG: hypothetical protein R3D45_01740 [Rhizobiaceae bacterium]
MSWLAIVGGVWGIAVLALFIPAIRYCYAAEKRSYPEKFEGRLPRRANMIAVAFNFAGIARDAETQALRWKMNRLLIVILASYLAMGIAIFAFGPG